MGMAIPVTMPYWASASLRVRPVPMMNRGINSSLIARIPEESSWLAVMGAA